jgi:NitT/TauT family transport system substrate-binding protein
MSKIMRACAMLAAVVVGVLGIASAAGAQTPLDPVRKLVLLQYNVVPDLGDAPLWMVPHALGYFADEGLDVSVQLAGGSSGAIQLLVAGRGNIATTTPDQLMIAVQKGLKIKAFFESNRTYGSALVVPVSANIKTTDQLKAYLKGNAIGINSLASGRINYARAWLRDLGLKEGTDTNIIAVGAPPQMAAALKSDRVRALTMYDAVYAAIETSSDIRFTRFETKWQQGLFSGLIIATDATIEKDPDVIGRYGRAVAKALLFATTNPEAVVRIYWALYPENRPKPGNEAHDLAANIAIVKSMLPNWLSGINGANWGTQSASDWEVVQKFNFDAGVLTGSLPTDSYYTNRFADEFDKFDQDAVRKQAQGFTESMIKSTTPN